MIKKLKSVPCALALGVLALSGAFNAHAEISYTATFVSDYIFEGVSQTSGDPALQGSIDYGHESGFYAGAWASNVDFGTDAKGAEIDLYFGFIGDIGDNIGFDVGYVDYQYRGDDFDGFGFGELYASLTVMDDTSLKIWLADDDNIGGSSSRFNLSHSLELSDNLSLNLAYYGWKTDDAIWNTHGAKEIIDGVHVTTEQGEDSYRGYQIGLSTEMAGFAVDLNYSDTDMNWWTDADGRFVLSVSKSFD